MGQIRSVLLPTLAATLTSACLRPGIGLLAFVAVARADCPTSGGEPVAVATVEARLELRLGDGRLMRLVGLDPAMATPDAPARAEAARMRFAASIAGHALTSTVLASAPDRWGRVSGMVFAAGGGPGGLAGAAIEAGLGRYRPEVAAHACRDVLLAAEARARTASLGLWSDPYYAVIAVGDEGGFAARSGTQVVASGVLAAVQPGPFRTLLRFAPNGLVDHPAAGSRRGQVLSASMLPRTTRLFKAQHVNMDALIGRTLRFRGLLDVRFGPRIELADPDDVEVLPSPDPATPPPTSPPPASP